MFILEINIWGIRRRTGKSRSLFPGFLFSLKRSSIARTVIETAGDLLTTSARGRRYKSRRQTYLAAATATTLVWKQLRVSLPPNPPPKEHKKDTIQETRKRTQVYNLLCHTKTTDYKMIVIILSKNSPILLVRTTILLAGTPRAFATSICRSKGMP